MWSAINCTAHTARPFYINTAKLNIMWRNIRNAVGEGTPLFFMCIQMRPGVKVEEWIVEGEWILIKRNPDIIVMIICTSVQYSEHTITTCSANTATEQHAWIQLSGTPFIWARPPLSLENTQEFFVPNPMHETMEGCTCSRTFTHEFVQKML